MPTYLNIIIFLCVEVFLVVIGGIVGAWLPVRNILIGAGGPGDGFAMVLFGELGMVVAGMIGIVILTIFWSVLAMRREAAGRKIGGIASDVPQAEGIWPPAPER